MLKFYYSLGPNPMKVALFLEEAGLEYEAVPVETTRGEQFSAAFLAINPNGKLPALVDGDVRVFDSNAILLYLSDKTGQFGAGDSAVARGALLSWLMFVASGLGPFSGQAVHFSRYAPESLPYAKQRYGFEAGRHYEVVNDHLAKNRYLLGERYSIADMALWGWARAVPFVLGDDAWPRFPNLKRLMDEIGARPAARRADALRERHAFKPMDDEARRQMFRHIESAASR